MATLYILDWHKRNYSNTRPYITGSGPQDPTKKPHSGTTKVGPGQMAKYGVTVYPEPDWVNVMKKKPPPVLATQEYTDCKQYCCPNR